MREILAQVAARLVAWMRWPGICAADELWDNFREKHPHFEPNDEHAKALLIAATEAKYGHPVDELYRHPLDGVMPYADRVAALGVCRVCYGGERILWDGHSVKCPHCRDGINWAAVAVLLDWMGEHGIPLDVVHEWRPAAPAPPDEHHDAADLDTLPVVWRRIWEPVV